MDKQLNEILKRIGRLEAAVFPSSGSKPAFRGISKKQITIAELSKGKKFKNGQEKIAFLVGYLEMVAKKEPIAEADIKQAWRDGKIDGAYANALLQRAVKDGLVRNLKDGSFDLTQTGEAYYEKASKE